jgi:cobalt-zinc-cadmium efflux system membrane fusion protein
VSEQPLLIQGTGLAERRAYRKYLSWGLVPAALIAGAAGLQFALPGGLPSLWPQGPKQRTVTETPLAVELVPDRPRTLSVPEDVRRSLGILRETGEAVAVAEPPIKTRPLVLPGSTDLDPPRIGRVRARFNADVIEVTKVEDETARVTTGKSGERELGPGDVVKKGDVLAVVWSVDVGSRKSDLVDALVQLALDEKRLQDRIELARNGSIPPDTLNQTRRDVAGDRNAVDRAERTLRTWNIPEREIEAVHDEAKRIVERGGQRDREKERLWARSELLAPRDGTIIERNIGIGEFIADNTVNLFVVAELDRLLVKVNAPEDYLQTLLDLPPERKWWTVQPLGVEAQHGPIEDIGYLVDPNLHSLVTKGHITNPPRRDERGHDIPNKFVLRAGQYVTATIDLPPPGGVVEVPVSAVVDETVFVQADPAHPSRFTLRRVLVTQRFDTVVFVKGVDLKPAEAGPTEEEKAEGLPPREPLRKGERVLTAGVLELKARLKELESQARK